MNRGTAKVIVNEVTSGRPTALNGFMEVAGRAASVVVANPDGIRVNGGGFINTSRAVLTTGRRRQAIRISGGGRINHGTEGIRRKSS